MKGTLSFVGIGIAQETTRYQRKSGLKRKGWKKVNKNEKSITFHYKLLVLTKKL